jgi:hypothetical protein
MASTYEHAPTAVQLVRSARVGMQVRTRHGHDPGGIHPRTRSRVQRAARCVLCNWRWPSAR